MKMNESGIQISATVFTLTNSYGSYSFLEDPVNIFHISILKAII